MRKEKMKKKEEYVEVVNPESEKIVAENVVVNSNSKFRKIMFLLLILATILAVFFYFQASDLENDPSKINEEKIAEIVEKVGKIIDLPKGETPTLAEVSDAQALQNQPFFANAKVGDIVLLYTVAQKAFLYDPQANIILEVASLNLGQ